MVPNLLDPSGTEVTCFGLGIEFIFAMGGSYTHGYCIDDCGNSAWVAFVRIGVGVGVGVSGGVIKPGVECIADLQDTGDRPCSCDVSLGVGPFGCTFDDGGGIGGTVGPVSGGSDGSGGIGGDIPGLPIPKPKVGKCGISGSTGGNFIRVISKNITKKCPCPPEPPVKPPRPLYCPKDQVEHSCSVICSDQRWVKSESDFNKCMEECMERAWNSGQDPLTDPYWN
jgi:hypothetical protein